MVDVHAFSMWLDCPHFLPSPLLYSLGEMCPFQDDLLSITATFCVEDLVADYSFLSSGKNLTGTNHPGELC